MSMADNASTKAFSREDRIKQLIDIDKNVVKLLHSAGLAVKALTSQASDSGNDDVEGRKEAFTSATAQYFTLLSSVDVNLRRQIYALEEANIISSDSAPKEASSQNSANPSSQNSKERSFTETGGLGSLDVGWLNSRNDKVGKEMEAELWTKMHSLLEKLDDQSTQSSKDVIMS